MPSIDNFSPKNKTQKFKKIAYRPWTVIEGGDREKTELNPVGYPLDNKSGNNQVTVGYPLDNKSGNNQVTVGYPLDNKSGNNQVYEEVSYHPNRLCGLQKKVLLYVAKKCLSSNDLSSGQLTIRELSTMLESTGNNIKTTLHRLVKKGFLQRGKGRSGNDGFTTFYIREAIKKTVLEYVQQDKFTEGLDNKLGTNPSLSSSNNIYINTTTTNATENENLLSNEWEEINIDPLFEIGFSKTHLVQIQKFGKLSAEQVQDSINAFAFDLQENNRAAKLKGSPLNFFMGIMRSGSPYAPPENYLSPEVRALKAYLEQKRLEQRKAEELRKEAFTFAFEDWQKNLTEEDVIQIIPEPRFREPNSPMRRGGLELHFRNSVWPLVLNAIQSRR